MILSACNKLYPADNCEYIVNKCLIIDFFKICDSIDTNVQINLNQIV